MCQALFLNTWNIPRKKQTTVRNFQFLHLIKEMYKKTKTIITMYDKTLKMLPLGENNVHFCHVPSV